MKILLVANTLPPADLSGVGEQVLQLAGGLERAGHEVRVLGRRRSGPGAGKLLFPLTVVPRILGELRRFRPRVVQVHESDGALAALAVRLAASRPRLVALLQVSYREELRSVRPLRYRGRVLGRPGWRERVFRYAKAPLQIALGRLTAKLADVVLAPSRRTAGEIERDYGVEAVRVLPNVLGGRRVPMIEDGSVGDAEGYLLYVGRLRVRKGLEVLFESLRSLGSAAPRTYVVGEGEHAPRLLDAARRLGLDDRVVFLGRRSPGEVRYLMSRAGALVVPSIYEGMPLVVLEAMASSLPVIASAVSGIPEVVEGGETGWLVAPEDPPALAAAIESWLEQPEEGRRRGAAGLRRLEERFTAERITDAWLDAVLGPEGPSISPAGVSQSDVAGPADGNGGPPRTEPSREDGGGGDRQR